MKYRGEDYNAELHLDLIDAYKTQKQTLTVNGENIRITIPAGIENEQTIKISGHGGPGISGGPNGDLYITFSIANYTKIKRLGNNLYATVDLDLYTAVLGGEITLDINLEGIETITHLLQRINSMQDEIIALRNRLRLYETKE